MVQGLGFFLALFKAMVWFLNEVGGCRKPSNDDLGSYEIHVSYMFEPACAAPDKGG